MKATTGYLIDPETGQVLEVLIDTATVSERLDKMYELLDCHTVDARRTMYERDVVYVDDEGMLRKPQYFFRFRGDAVLAGRGLVVGTTEGGDDADPAESIESVRERVEFYRLIPDTVCDLLGLRRGTISREVFIHEQTEH